MNLTVGERLKDLLDARGKKIQRDIVNNGILCHKTHLIKQDIDIINVK